MEVASQKKVPGASVRASAASSSLKASFSIDALDYSVKVAFFLSVRVGHLRCGRHTLDAESSFQRIAVVASVVVILVTDVIEGFIHSSAC